MDKHAKQRLILKYIEAYNAFDIDEMMSVLHEKVMFENLQNGIVSASAENKIEFRVLADHAKTLFSHRNQTITDTEFGDKTALIGIAYTGVLASDLPNGMKAGSKLELSGHTEFEFADGLISLVRDIS